MALGTEDLEKLALLTQRRYNSLREVRKLTREAAEAVDRQDDVSVDLVLRMRGEELERCDRIWQEILQSGEESEDAAGEIRRLFQNPPDQVETHSDEEMLIERTRLNCCKVIREIKEQDRILNLRVGRDQSIFYGEKP